MKNVAKCDTWCELQNPVNNRVFECKLRPKPSGRGHVCLGRPSVRFAWSLCSDLARAKVRSLCSDRALPKRRYDTSPCTLVEPSNAISQRPPRGERPDGRRERKRRGSRLGRGSGSRKDTRRHGKHGQRNLPRHSQADEDRTRRSNSDAKTTHGFFRRSIDDSWIDPAAGHGQGDHKNRRVRRNGARGLMKGRSFGNLQNSGMQLSSTDAAFLTSLTFLSAQLLVNLEPTKGVSRLRQQDGDHGKLGETRLIALMHEL
ncbi:unnamed protein product [Brassica rapa]|uniref:Uncharacterized protein n=1 Tax=Brassica campestris TaxID=3711 RepID=A0A8D9D7Q4_BRACM|nr:unnamed protein product [Brassica rapa]